MRCTGVLSLALLQGVAAAATWTRPSAADPQAGVGLTAGAVEDDITASGRKLDLHLGARGDMLFGRSSDRDMGLGPYVDTATAGFHDSDFGGGLDWLVPAIPEVPFTFSAGAFVRNGDGRSWAPGIETTLAIGSRGYNYHSWYSLAANVFVQARWLPESPASTDLVVGVQVDLELIAMPFLLLGSALAHGG